jgi:hypothetical protein
LTEYSAASRLFCEVELLAGPESAIHQVPRLQPAQ